MSSAYKTNRKILLGQDNNALVLLFAINTLMFVIINFIRVVYFLSEIPEMYFYRQVLDWLSLPAAPDVLITRPWTIITYMVSHGSIWQLISSMLWLWCFGYILQDLAGNNKLIPLYIYGGLAGALAFLLLNNTVPVLAGQVSTLPPMLGAGAAVMAVAIATTTLSPNYRIFPLINGGIPLWVIALIFVAIDFATMGGAYTGLGIAHLAGGLTGFMYTWQLRKGRDWGLWMNRFANWLDDLFNPEKKHRSSGSGKKQFYRSNGDPYHKKPNLTQQRLDEILDKINQQGYQFLSDEEKEFLKKASKEEF